MTPFKRTVLTVNGTGNSFLSSPSIVSSNLIVVGAQNGNLYGVTSSGTQVFSYFAGASLRALHQHPPRADAAVCMQSLA